MNELLAKAGAVFLAPAPPVAIATRAPAPPPDLVCVLAAPRDLAVVAGGLAAGLRRRHRARAALVCAPAAPPPGRPPTRAARGAAARMAGRDLTARAFGAVCHVTLPAEPEAAARYAWRAIAAATGFPAVVALAEHADEHDALLAHADLLLLAAASTDDPHYVELALAGLAALGPPTALIRPPAGFIKRRAAALGVHPLHAEAVPA